MINPMLSDLRPLQINGPNVHARKSLKLALRTVLGAPCQFEAPPMAINHTHNALPFIAFIDDLTCDLFRLLYGVADYEV